MGGSERAVERRRRGSVVLVTAAAAAAAARKRAAPRPALRPRACYRAVSSRPTYSKAYTHHHGAARSTCEFDWSHFRLPVPRRADGGWTR